MHNRKTQTDSEDAPGMLWTAAEESVLMLSREMEWAEAYAADNADCLMGSAYLDFLRWELIAAQGAL